MADGNGFTRESTLVGAVLLAAAAVLLVACGGGSSSGGGSTPTATARSTPAATPSPPPGGPAPASLVGTWRLMPFSAREDNNVDLALHANTFSFSTSGEMNFGDLAVNGSEIDFYNGDGCGLSLPDGVGTYTWTVTGRTLHFTPLGSDPCSMRSSHLSDQSYAKQAS